LEYRIITRLLDISHGGSIRAGIFYFKSTGEWQYIRITMKFVAMRFEILQ